MTNSISLFSSAEHPRVGLGASLETHAVVALTGHGGAVDTVRPQLTVVFVLDVSGSMSGEPLQQVKDSVETLCRLLQPTDQVGVAAFSSNPVRVAEVQPLSTEHQASIRRRLLGIQASGSTMMTSGLELGFGMLPPRKDNERQLVVLLTDGEPTDGSTGESLGAMAGALRKDVTTITLGYGIKHRADLLDAVAKAGGGQYWYIPDPAEANLEFARALGAQADIVVDGIEMVLRPADGVEIVGTLDGARPRFSADGLVLERPSLRDGQVHTTIVSLKVDPFRETGRWPLLTVQVRYREAGRTERQLLEGRVDVDVVHGAGATDDVAHRAVALARAENTRHEARKQADVHRFDAAAAMLKPVVASLEALPGYQKLDGSDVSEAVEQLVDEIIAYESKPSAQQYMEFRSSTMGVDIAQGGVHAADQKMKSATSKALMHGVAAGAGFEVTIEKKGETGVRVERFSQGELTIGRVQGNDLVLPSGSISKRHTRIVQRDGRLIAVCLKSTNGTYVNGQRLQTPKVLADNDVINIGDFTLKVRPVGSGS